MAPFRVCTSQEYPAGFPTLSGYADISSNHINNGCHLFKKELVYVSSTRRKLDERREGGGGEQRKMLVEPSVHAT